MVKVIKRDCTEANFNKEKILNAILKAMTSGSGIVKPKIAEDIADEIFEETKDREEVSISEIESMVFDKLISKKQRLTARAYEGYRSIREFQREENELDDVVYGIVEGTDKEVLDENSNKNAYIAPTQRDLIAGELSRNYSRRNLLPINITQAHDEGVIHFHDADYFVQHIHNCQLVNLEDMLQNGTVINTKMIEKPKSFTKDREEVSISEIESMVFDKLISKKQRLTARAYEGYRSIREFQREENELDDVVYGIVEGTDKEVLDENSNKNAYIAPTQRDLIAGELSRNYSRRNLLPINITQAHDEGVIHFHDADYFVQHIHNCQLVNLEDMLQNGTVINTKMIEKPKSFQTACTVATQIVQQVANSQYGGQTITLSHLAPFVRISREKWVKRVIQDFEETGVTYNMEHVNYIADKRLREEIKAGIQTIQFQVNTFNTSNGQSPFLTVFMYISENPEYEKETAMLIEEVLNQRYEGMKNEVGVPVTPSFPKLIFVLDENNIFKDSKYYYLKKLACKCVAKRMMPDFISAKIMKQNYDGEVFPCMGCRSFLSNWKDENGKYKWYGRFNQGVVTLNLVDIGLSADKDMDKFWNILDERLRLCYQALMLRHERLEGTSTTISPIHWQYGAIARLSKDDKIDDLLHNGYSTISLGYAGLYECVLSMLGVSHTAEEGEKFALAVMNKLKATCDKWKKDTGIGFGLYGTPLESTTYKFARKLRDRFGVIEGITDKDYITNSYHVNVREEIDAFRKLGFEAQFQKISSGGAVSYVEVTNLNCKTI